MMSMMPSQKIACLAGHREHGTEVVHERVTAEAARIPRGRADEGGARRPAEVR